MKFSFAFVSTLAAFAVAAPSAIVEKRETTTIQDFMSALTSQVKEHTSKMNQVVAALPASASMEQKKEASASVIDEINAITGIFKEANTKVAAAKNNKRAKQPTLGDLPHDILGQLNGQPIVLAKLLLPLLQELNPALQSVLVTLSLGEVYVALQPLLRTELPTLVTGLGNLVNGLLVALAPLLAGLGGILGPLLLGLGL